MLSESERQEIEAEMRHYPAADWDLHDDLDPATVGDILETYRQQECPYNYYSSATSRELDPASNSGSLKSSAW